MNEFVMMSLPVFQRDSGVTREIDATGRITDLHHFEQMLRRAAVRTNPIFGDVLPPCTGGEPMLRQAEGFVIGKSAAEAHPTLQGNFHLSTPTDGERRWISARKLPKRKNRPALLPAG